ncbi:MAG: site-2 protease family protein [Deltaproteobacteria bacterium]|nr:site-2 protease family protein [Deltaproteobacteria bacterium]
MTGDTLQIVIQVLALLFAVSFHESAHGWVAWKCGDPTARDLGRISLNPLRHIDPVGSVLVPAVLAFSGAPVFGWAKPVPVALDRTRDPRSANLLISAAGPISNLILAGLFAIAITMVRQEDGSFGVDSRIGAALLWFGRFSVRINVVLAVFNLLPIPPLDGFGVLESLLPRSMAPLAYWMRHYGMLILLAVILSGALSWILAPAQNAVLHWMLGRS